MSFQMPIQNTAGYEGREFYGPEKNPNFKH